MHVFKFASSLLGDSQDYSRNAPAGQGALPCRLFAFGKADMAIAPRNVR